jgi:hypothetical protein
VARRGVRVRRLVRRFELWSVLRIALFFHAICGAVSLGVSIVLWNVLVRLGSVEKLESFLSDLLGTADFQIDSQVLLKAGIGITGALVVLNVVMTVLLAFIYNMLSTILGGVVVGVIEERPVKRTRRGLRRSPEAAAAPAATARARRRRAAGSARPAGGAAVARTPARTAPSAVVTSGAAPVSATTSGPNGHAGARVAPAGASAAASPVELALASTETDDTDGWMRPPAVAGNPVAAPVEWWGSAEPR